MKIHHVETTQPFLGQALRERTAFVSFMSTKLAPSTIHAPARGATSTSRKWSRFGRSFNPRPRARGDKGTVQRPGAGEVSIHAPARGATRQIELDRCHADVSIHAPARGATCPGKGLKHEYEVSIHAPARGATPPADIDARLPAFQSTPPREGRHARSATVTMATRFNPRPRARGDIGSGTERWPSIGFNPRPRARGDATGHAHPFAKRPFQSTPPREGRPWRGRSESAGLESFNPRPRARGDMVSCIQWCRRTSFNPRPRARGDGARAEFESWLQAFQSTPPREGRPDEGDDQET